MWKEIYEIARQLARDASGHDSYSRCWVQVAQTDATEGDWFWQHVAVIWGYRQY